MDVPFEEFVKFLLTPQSEDALGSGQLIIKVKSYFKPLHLCVILISVCFTTDTLYFFGDNNFTEWHSLFEQYKAPPYSLPHMRPAYSFGIAGMCAHTIFT